MLGALGACKTQQDSKLPDEPFRQVRSTGPAESPPSSGAAIDAKPSAVPPPFEFTDCPPPVPLYAPPKGVKVELTIGKAVFERNEPVPLRLGVTNTGDRPVERTWPRDKQDRDYWVANSAGTVWRWAYGDDSFRGGAGSTVYQPGETRSLTPEKWGSDFCLNGKQVSTERSPGKYAAFAYVVNGEFAWASNQVDLEIR